MGTIIFIIMCVLSWLLFAAQERDDNIKRANGELPPKIGDSLIRLYNARQQRKATELASLQALRAAQTEALLASSQVRPVSHQTRSVRPVG